jgi:MerR family transcriptional regulator, heat shock protein HspR
MGTAAELLGVQPAFLRSLDAAGLLSPGRSAGGQRRYSRADLTLAMRVRALLDQNMPLAAATRIVSLEHQLAAAHRRITHLEQTAGQRRGRERPRRWPSLTPQRRSQPVGPHRACVRRTRSAVGSVLDRPATAGDQ